MKNKPLLITIAFLIIAISSVAQLTDNEGTIYQTIKIGMQTWMAENLNLSHFQNGDRIPEAKTSEEWKKANENGKPAWCYYDNDPKNGKKYGKLYNWNAVNDLRGLAPVGWHIPSDAEWTQLTDYLGGASLAGTKMKNNNGWEKKSYGENGTNESGFAGLPGGNCFGNGKFEDLDESGIWWSSTGKSLFQALCLIIYDSRESSAFIDTMNKEDGFSIRCVRDENPPQPSYLEHSISCEKFTEILSALKDGSIRRAQRSGSASLWESNINLPGQVKSDINSSDYGKSSGHALANYVFINGSDSKEDALEIYNRLKQLINQCKSVDWKINEDESPNSYKWSFEITSPQSDWVSISVICKRTDSEYFVHLFFTNEWGY
jgi:uncharacterized protein (TIGR02145 family)